MRSSSLQTSLSRHDLAESLALAPPVIDALVESGALLCHVRDGRETIPVEQVEALFRDGLLRLYQAEAAARMRQQERSAEHQPPPEQNSPQALPAGDAPPGGVPRDTNGAHDDEIAIDIEPAAAQPDGTPTTLASSPVNGEDEPVITRGYAGDEQLPVEKLDLRVAPRFIPRRQVSGMFVQTKFSILQISNTGLRIRHDETLLPGEEGRVTFALIKPPQSFILKGRVVWTSIAQRGDGPTFCISGIRVTDGVERLRRAVDLLRAARELEPERDSGRRSIRGTQVSPTAQSPPALRGLSDDEVASILRAVRKLASDPAEASRWYARARFAMVDEQVRAAIPPRARDREEILGVWEYLERRIDVRKVAGVVSWMRSTRAAVM